MSLSDVKLIENYSYFVQSHYKVSFTKNSQRELKNSSKNSSVWTFFLSQLSLTQLHQATVQSRPYLSQQD